MRVGPVNDYALDANMRRSRLVNKDVFYLVTLTLLFHLTLKSSPAKYLCEELKNMTRLPDNVKMKLVCVKTQDNEYEYNVVYFLYTLCFIVTGLRLLFIAFHRPLANRVVYLRTLH